MKDLFESMFGAIAAPFILAVGFAVFFYTFHRLGIDVMPILSVALALSPIWLPLAIFFILYERWMDFVHAKFKAKNGRSTLRIMLPQDVFKSPEAMESVIAQIHNQQSIDNLWQSYIDGKHRLVFSFELVSHGGDVRFYINVPTSKTKNAVESMLYAQYPGIEIIEEPVDYTAEITWDPEKYEMMAFHVGKKKDEIYPIKTYIDFGLDKLPKEEEKFEPMAAMLEHMSTAKPHERIWMQILAVPHAEKNFKTGHLTPSSTWEKKIEKKISETMQREAPADPDEKNAQPRLTSGERDTITAMERNGSKYAYETAIRWMYITEKGKFNGDFIAPMLRSFAQYDVIGRNGLGARWRTDFDYNWFSDFSGKRKMRLKKEEFEYYKARAYETRDVKGGADAPKVFSAEELATIYHIPGRAIVTPGVSRVPSTRREAPANLPIKEF